MGTCNIAQNEMGGKELAVKKCIELTAGTTNASANLNVSSDHKAKVGDIVKFKTIGALTVVNTDDYYYVKSVVDADTITVSANKSGAALVFDATVASPGVVFDLFKSIGGIRSKSMSLSSEAIDITNEESDEWMAKLDAAGVRSMSISGSGVYSSASGIQELEASFMANELVCLLFQEYKTGRLWVGCFKLTQLEVSGDYNAESNFSISAESSGAIALFAQGV